MNNHALKLVNEKGSVSIKIHDLYKMPEEEFRNQEKMNLYERGKYYHKSQRGILRVSKYEFFSTEASRNSEFELKDIEIFAVDKNFDYKNNPDSSTVTWYMNFAAEIAFSNRDTASYSMEDIQIMEMPLLFKASRYIKNDYYSCITPSTYTIDCGYTFATPVLFENVPQWYEIRDIYNLKNNKPVTMDKKNNILSMKAPFGIKEQYNRSHMNFLCQTLFAGFGGVLNQAAKSKMKNIEFHTGNWGCGALNNNKELIYLSQMIVASIMGFKSICFHNADQTEFKTALEKFYKMERKITFENLLTFLDSQNYKIDL